MQYKLLIIILLTSCIACNNVDKDKSQKVGNGTKPEMVFDKTKWRMKEGPDYLYRDKMLDDVVYNDTIRKLDKSKILDLLGEPDRTNENHLYYMISQNRIGAWPLNTKTMVIKLYDDNTIEWIKIHE